MIDLRLAAAPFTLLAASLCIFQSPESSKKLQFISSPRGELKQASIELGDKKNLSETLTNSIVNEKDPTSFIDSEDTPSVHSSCMAELPDGSWVAYWFGGTREGAADVEIRGSKKVPGQNWQKERTIIKRELVQKEMGRHIKKLGNPIVITNPQGEIFLFFVSVSFGGWSGSAINMTKSSDFGETWSPPVRLITSPFFNISTLVRSRPVWLADGNLLIPAYHELIGKFCELLIVSPEGKVLDKIRISSGRGLIQPWLVPTDTDRAVVFMRSAIKDKPYIHRVDIDSNSISPPQIIDLPNPNASVAAAKLDNGDILMVYNNAKSGRRDLTLNLSSDEGKTWKGPICIEDESGAPENRPGFLEYSYPWLIRGQKGEIQLSYTWMRTRIKMRTLNAPAL